MSELEAESIRGLMNDIVMKLHYLAPQLKDPALVRRARACADELYKVIGELRVSDIDTSYFDDLQEST